MNVDESEIGQNELLYRSRPGPWPKAFVNLRSTRRTELQEAFPIHVVNAWLGHSEKVAETIRQAKCWVWGVLDGY